MRIVKETSPIKLDTESRKSDNQWCSSRIHQVGFLCSDLTVNFSTNHSRHFHICIPRVGLLSTNGIRLFEMYYITILCWIAHTILMILCVLKISLMIILKCWGYPFLTEWMEHLWSQNGCLRPVNLALAITLTSILLWLLYHWIDITN